MKTLETITLSRVHSALEPKHAAGTRHHVERRPSYAISFSFGGEIVYRHGEDTVVSDEGSVIIHPMGGNYDFTCTKGGAFGVINFYTTHFFTDRFIKIALGDTSLLAAKFYEIKEALLSGVQRHRAMRLAYEVLEMLSESEAVGENALAAAAMRRLKTMYTDHAFTVSALAAAVHVSESYLRRIFNDTYGISPKRALLNARLDRAKRLLGEGTGSVGEIAEECGFSGVYHFCRAFKSAVGETPTEYRAKHRLGMSV